jgi:hypothetical protein
MNQGRFGSARAGRRPRTTPSAGELATPGVASRLSSRWAAAVVVATLAVCCLPAAASASVSAATLAAGQGPGGLPHALGLIPTPSRAAVARPSTAAAPAALPASVDLTPYAMPVGNQGDVGSCAAWASDYTALGYWENREGIAGGGLEPMYTYSQVTGGVDDGSTIEGNLAIDKQQGVDNQADYSQGNFDYWDMPTVAETAHAANWKLTSYADLAVDPSSSSTVTQQSIEAALAAGDPVVIGLPVYDNFFYVTAANNGYYDSISGGLAGYHAITALGYNSSGLVIENSWGSGWGNGGFATLGWDFVNGYVFDAVSVGPLVTGQPVASTAPAVTGAPKVGQTLSASTGAWSASPTAYAYQWQRAAAGTLNWLPINGATGSTYQPVTADVGYEVRVQVTATAAQGQGISASAAVGPVTSNAPFATAAPTITGTLRQAQTLTATLGTWSPAGSSYSYQWQRSTNTGATWSNIAGASGATYLTTTADVGAYERVLVTATNSYGSTTASSAEVGSIATAAPYVTTPPTISGALRLGQTLSATAGSWSPAGTSYSYQWQRSTNAGSSWSNIAGAGGATYVTTAADTGAYDRVVVTAVNGFGATAADSAQVGPISSAPFNVSAPTITGALRLGQTLSVSTGSWSPAATSYTYQWQRSTNYGSSWTSISGASGATYVTSAADVGAYDRVVVTAANASGTATVASAQVGPFVGAPYNTVAPTVTGTPRETQYLYATTGTWSPAGTSYAYQWQRSYDGGKTWVSVWSETNSYYAIEPSDVGNLVRVQVAATNTYGTTYAWTTVGPVTSAAPVNTALPLVTGTLREGQALSASIGGWSPSGDYYTYQWQRSTNSGSSWSNIPGATSSSYVTGALDVNARERVIVTAVNSFGSASATAASVGAVSGVPYNTTAAGVSGTPRQGQTLTVSTGVWSPTASSFSYQWQRSTNAGSSWSNIPGATSATYVIVAADVNAYERVVITAANGAGSTTVDTAKVGPVASAAPSSTVAPALSGTPRQGQTLTASPGSWSAAGATYAYQWQRSSNGSTWSSISGANADTYVPTSTDVNDYVRVVVTASNGYGTASATSAQSARVAAATGSASTTVHARLVRALPAARGRRSRSARA